MVIQYDQRGTMKKMLGGVVAAVALMSSLQVTEAHCTSAPQTRLHRMSRHSPAVRVMRSSLTSRHQSKGRGYSVSVKHAFSYYRSYLPKFVAAYVTLVRGYASLLKGAALRKFGRSPMEASAPGPQRALPLYRIDIPDGVYPLLGALSLLMTIPSAFEYYGMHQRALLEKQLEDTELSVDAAQALRLKIANYETGVEVARMIKQVIAIKTLQCAYSLGRKYPREWSVDMLKEQLFLASAPALVAAVIGFLGLFMRKKTLENKKKVATVSGAIGHVLSDVLLLLFSADAVRIGFGGRSVITRV